MKNRLFGLTATFGAVIALFAATGSAAHADGNDWSYRDRYENIRYDRFDNVRFDHDHDREWREHRRFEEERERRIERERRERWEREHRDHDGFRIDLNFGHERH